MTAIALTDVWAVGFYDTPADGALTLTEHWNGVKWSVVPSPSPAKSQKSAEYLADNTLGAVVAASHNDVWAVGSESNGTDPDHSLIIHWNGAKWKLVPSAPPAKSIQQTLYAAAIAGNDNVWAVRNFDAGSESQPLAEHWSGSTWGAVPTPPLNTTAVSLNRFNGLAAQSSQNVWAVGDMLAKGYHALIEHWNGATWKVAPNPAPNTETEILSAVASSSSDVWAVGQQGLKGKGPVLIEHLASCPAKA